MKRAAPRAAPQAGRTPALALSVDNGVVTKKGIKYHGKGGMVASIVTVARLA